MAMCLYEVWLLLALAVLLDCSLLQLKIEDSGYLTGIIWSQLIEIQSWQIFMSDRSRKMFLITCRWFPSVWVQLKFLSLFYLSLKGGWCWYDVDVTHLDASLVIIVDGAGHHVGPGVRLQHRLALLGVFADWSEGGAGGAEDWEVAGLLRVEAGGGVEERVAGREEGGWPELCRPPQLVDVILQLLQLLQVSGLQGSGVQQGRAGSAWNGNIFRN